MKALISIITLITGLFQATNTESVKVWTVDKESTISILGSSNVNTFNFNLKKYNGNNTIIAVQKGSDIVFKKGVVRSSVTDFKKTVTQFL